MCDFENTIKQKPVQLRKLHKWNFQTYGNNCLSSDTLLLYKL